MSLREAFMAQHPGFPLLTAGDTETLEALASSGNWLEPGEQVLSSVKAGEGNMNLTLRVQTSQRTLIVKQSRPWVEKYDQIEAPFDRALVEEAFYRRVSAISPVAERMPRLLGSDPSHRVLVLEDLGESSDLSSLYGGSELSEVDISQLGSYLAHLHGATRDTFRIDNDALLKNLEMRDLNRQHIFEIPLAKENGLELESFEPGLSAVADSLKSDDRFCGAAHELAGRYMADGPVLVHGDFFPGSWMRTDHGLRVIDPEFCFFGDPEFDLGVAVAHLFLAGKGALGKTLIRSAYTAGPLEDGLLASYAGIEIMRRLIGVAQLPMAATEGLRKGFLEVARTAVVDENLEVFF